MFYFFLGLEYDEWVQVDALDLVGPLSSVPSKETDYFLYVSYILVAIIALVNFALSDTAKNLWLQVEHLFSHTERVHID